MPCSEGPIEWTFWSPMCRKPRARRVPRTFGGSPIPDRICVTTTSSGSPNRSVRGTVLLVQSLGFTVRDSEEYSLQVRLARQRDLPHPLSGTTWWEQAQSQRERRSEGVVSQDGIGVRLDDGKGIVPTCVTGNARLTGCGVDHLKVGEVPWLQRLSINPQALE